MSDTKWCVVKKRGTTVWGPFDGMDEAYQSIEEDVSMAAVEVKPMRDGSVSL